jgi:hypothetical protein
MVFQQTEYDYPTTEIAKEQTKGFRETIESEKHKSLSKTSPFTVSFYSQVKAAVSRQFEIL